MQVYSSGWYETAGHRAYDTSSGTCDGRVHHRDGDTFAIRRHKGSSRRKRFHCVNITTEGGGKMTGNDFVRWGAGNEGHHPCKNIGQSYSYKNNSSFPSSHFGFRCTVPENKIPGLISANSAHINAAGATDSNGTRATIKKQLLFGATMKGGQQTGKGYCMKYENLAKKFGNETCYQLIESQVNKAQAEQNARAYCETPAGRMDEKCKCINVAGSGFLARCRANPTWAGCKEIIPGVNALEKLLAKTNIPEGQYGNADCIVPDICSGNVYKPMAGTPACRTQMAVCNQIMQQSDVKAYGDLSSVQSCNIDFSAEQDKRSQAVKKAEQDAAAAAAAKDAADAAAAKDAAAKKAAADQEAAAAQAPAPASIPTHSDKTPASTPTDAADGVAPTAADGVAVEQEIIDKGMDQNTKIAIGVGGGVVVLCCCLLLVMMMMGGGGRRRR